MRESGIFITCLPLDKEREVIRAVLMEEIRLAYESFGIVVINDVRSGKDEMVNELLRGIESPQVYLDDPVEAIKEPNEFINNKMKWKKERWRR